MKRPTRPGHRPTDKALWRQVAATVSPLQRKKRVAHVGDAEPSPGEPPRPAPHMRRSPAPLVAPPPQERARLPEPTPPAPSNNFDRRQKRRVASGRDEITARLDLHGLREHEAHMRLSQFIRRSAIEGHRLVLVITGKGRDDTGEPAGRFELGQVRRGSGVLRRNVPRWLAEPGIAPFVVSYSEATPRHGGAGALYVRLRRMVE